LRDFAVERLLGALDLLEALLQSRHALAHAEHHEERD
jgi:hypothetical protein